MVIAPDAVERLGRYAPPDALVVSDANTREAVGGRVLAALPRAAELVFERRDGLLAGLGEVEAVRVRLGDRGALIAAGSGTITDIVRYAAELSDVPFLSVPSAASMDGYASSVAALQIDGVKVTLPARSPVAVFADPRVAAAAPLELTRAGVGDLLAKATARVDWLAAHLLYGEPFDEAVDARVLGSLRFAADRVEEVLAGGEEAVGGLLRGLIQSGLAIATVGNSRPASGCEHHASHFWDLLAARGRRPHGLHGLQVGYATGFAMRLQRYAFGGGVAGLRPPAPDPDPFGDDARAWLGEPTADIVAAATDKQRFAAQLGSWPRDASAWSAVQGRLASALAVFDSVEMALNAAGLTAEPGLLGIDGRTLDATFRYASRLRARYTVIDFLEGQRKLDEALSVTLAR